MRWQYVLLKVLPFHNKKFQNCKFLKSVCIGFLISHLIKLRFLVNIIKKKRVWHDIMLYGKKKETSLHLYNIWNLNSTDFYWQNYAANKKFFPLTFPIINSNNQIFNFHNFCVIFKYFKIFFSNFYYSRWL